MQTMLALRTLRNKIAASFKKRVTILDLPEDIIQYIFEIGTWSDLGSNFPFTLPYTIAAVCRSFRTTALGTPTFWTFIHWSAHRPTETITQRLVLSGRCPLTVHVDFRIPAYSTSSREVRTNIEHGELAAEIGQLLFRLFSTHFKAHIYRIRSLTLLSDGQLPLSSLSLRLLSKVEWSQLEFFEIKRSRRFDLSVDEDFELLEGPLPSLAWAPGNQIPLKTVSYINIFVDWSSWNLSKLTNLTICFVSPAFRPTIEQLSEILSCSASTLEYLELQSSVPLPSKDDTGQFVAPSFSPDSRIVLPKLREFKLGMSHWAEGVHIFKKIVTPNLAKLTLRDVGRASLTASHRPMYSHHLAKVMEVLCAPGSAIPSVTCLQLEWICFGSDDRLLPVRFIAAFPRLHSLVVLNSSGKFVECLDHTLAIGSDGLPTLIAPYLAEVTVVGRHGISTEDMLIPFIMRHARLQRGNAGPSDALSRLKKLALYDVPRSDPRVCTKCFLKRLEVVAEHVLVSYEPYDNGRRPGPAVWVVDPDEPVREGQFVLSTENWERLSTQDKEAFRLYLHGRMHPNSACYEGLLGVPCSIHTGRHHEDNQAKQVKAPRTSQSDITDKPSSRSSAILRTAFAGIILYSFFRGPSQ